MHNTMGKNESTIKSCQNVPNEIFCKLEIHFPNANTKTHYIVLNDNTRTFIIFWNILDESIKYMYDLAIFARF